MTLRKWSRNWLRLFDPVLWTGARCQQRQTLGSMEGKLGAHKHQEKSRCPGSKTGGTDAGELESRAELSFPALRLRISALSPLSPDTIFSALLCSNSKLLRG